MVNSNSIVVNGDLGSGKTAVSIEIASRLGLRRISVGDLYREIAQRRGMTALELNIHAELDDTIDGYVDQLQRDIAASDERLVVDSRLAWFFFSSALKVHLIADSTIAAERVLSRPSSDVESYSSVEEAKEHLRSRSESERIRFLTRYGADRDRMRNYDLVIDTSSATPSQVVDRVVAAVEGFSGARVLADSPPLLFLDPARIYPSHDIRELRGLWSSDFVATVGEAGADSLDPLAIGLADGCFYVIDGHRRLSAALQNGFKLISGFLFAEAVEPVIGGQTAIDYFRSSVTLSTIYDWEAAHESTLPLPPHIQAEIAQISTGQSM